jgi:putative tricarboxylic transport membrane protein
VISTAITDLWYGFGVALEPHNLMYCFLGVLVGNLVGVLPGMGPVATISILLPLTFGMQPVPAILMLSGVYYGAQYGGAICSILLNLPCHPPHAVTCLDGFPLTKQGKGGTALGITIIAAFIGASFGITEMIFLAPFLVKMALEFGPAEVCSLMLVGLLAGSTLAKGSPLKGIAMTVLGLLVGIVGSDIETGQPRFTFGITELFDGVEIIALALGMFGIAEFMNSINNTETVDMKYAKVGISDMFPSKADLKLAFWPMIRGTFIGSLCALIPGTGPTIASFVSYATEKKISKTPERFGHGAIEGVACPEASTHSSVQGDFIPTMSLGIPGDTVMALLLGALIIHGIVPGPQLISQHADIFWGLIASFWIGNILLVILNVPMIGLWVKLLSIPYRYLYPSAMFFVCIGVYAANNDMFQVGETAGDRRGRIHPAAPRFPSGADPARLRARAALRGKLPAQPLDLPRRPDDLHRASDQRVLPPDLRGADHGPDLCLAAQAEDHHRGKGDRGPGAGHAIFGTGRWRRRSWSGSRRRPARTAATVSRSIP